MTVDLVVNCHLCQFLVGILLSKNQVLVQVKVVNFEVLGHNNQQEGLIKGRVLILDLKLFSYALTFEFELLLPFLVRASEHQLVQSVILLVQHVDACVREVNVVFLIGHTTTQRNHLLELFIVSLNDVHFRRFAVIN